MMFDEWLEAVHGLRADDLDEDDWDRYRDSWEAYLDDLADRHGAYDLATGGRCKA